MNPDEQVQDPAQLSAIVKAIAYTENGGKPNVSNLSAGQSGELKSIFQFTPDTWKNYAQQVLGDANAPLNPENEIKVVTAKVNDWLKQGKSVEQIASMWNAGPGEPDAYTGQFSNGKPSSGTNSSGVAYSVPSYAKKVASYTSQFLSQNGAQSTQANTSTPSPSISPIAAIVGAAGTIGSAVGSKMSQQASSQSPAAIATSNVDPRAALTAILQKFGLKSSGQQPGQDAQLNQPSQGVISSGRLAAIQSPSFSESKDSGKIPGLLSIRKKYHKDS